MLQKVMNNEKEKMVDNAHFKSVNPHFKSVRQNIVSSEKPERLRLAGTNEQADKKGSNKKQYSQHRPKSKVEI